MGHGSLSSDRDPWPIWPIQFWWPIRPIDPWPIDPLSALPSMLGFHDAIPDPQYQQGNFYELLGFSDLCPTFNHIEIKYFCGIRINCVGSCWQGYANLRFTPSCSRVIECVCMENVNVNVRHTYWAPLNPVTEALHAVELTSFMWHMPEGVAEHSFLGGNHQSTCMPSYSIYVQLLWYRCTYPEGMKARVSPVQWSKPHSICDHYTTAAHHWSEPLKNTGLFHVFITVRTSSMWSYHWYQTHLRSFESRSCPDNTTTLRSSWWPWKSGGGERHNTLCSMNISVHAWCTLPHHPPSTSARCRAITRSQGPEWLHLFLHGSHPRNPMPAKTARRLIDLQTPIIVSREEKSGPSPSVIDHSDSTSWPSIRQTSRPVGACHR